MKLILYKQANCAYCDLLRDNLKQWGVNFTTISIDNNEIAKNFLKSNGKKTVPQLYINSTCINENIDTVDITENFIFEQIGRFSNKYYGKCE